MIYRIFVNHKTCLEFLADSFTSALEMFVEDTGFSLNDIHHVEEWPQRKQYRVPANEVPLFI